MHFLKCWEAGFCNIAHNLIWCTDGFILHAIYIYIYICGKKFHNYAQYPDFQAFLLFILFTEVFPVSMFMSCCVFSHSYFMLSSLFMRHKGLFFFVNGVRLPLKSLFMQVWAKLIHRKEFRFITKYICSKDRKTKMPKCILDFHKVFPTISLYFKMYLIIVYPVLYFFA